MCACLCGGLQQRREAVPQYRRALVLPLQYFRAVVNLFSYWSDQPLARLESHVFCGPSNCGYAVTILQLYLYDRRASETCGRRQMDYPGHAKRCGEMCHKFCNSCNHVLSSSCRSGVSKSGEGRRACGVKELFTLSLIYKHGHAISENSPIFRGTATL